MPIYLVPQPPQHKYKHSHNRMYFVLLPIPYVYSTYLLFHFSSEEFTVSITQRTKLMRETYLGESQTKLNDADSFRVNVAATQVKITTISCVLGRNRYTTTILKYRRRRIASHFRSIKTLHTTYCAAACLCLQWIQFLTIWICSTLLNSLCFSAAKSFTKYSRDKQF